LFNLLSDTRRQVRVEPRFDAVFRMRLSGVNDAATPRYLKTPRHLKRRPEQQKDHPRAAFANLRGMQEKFGAGEAIRTPDPNLGKVMLYP
jgi:hypothetical protein